MMARRFAPPEATLSRLKNDSELFNQLFLGRLRDCTSPSLRGRRIRHLGAL